jgi:hypothetical protein
MKTLKYDESAIRDIVTGMHGRDCGSHSCLFAINKVGQRTNGGCSCLHDRLPQLVKIGITKLYNSNKENL